MNKPGRQTPWGRALGAEEQSEKELEQEACLVCLKHSWDSDVWSRRRAGRISVYNRTSYALIAQAGTTHMHHRVLCRTRPT